MAADTHMHQIRVLHKEEHEIEDLGSVNESHQKKKQIYLTGSCQHNAKFACVFIPCAIPLVYLSGNLLLGVSAFAAICLYLVQHASRDRKSIIAAFTASILVIQLATIYSLIPLVWQSFFNIGIIFIYNVFLVSSGGIGLLQLKQMHIEEPDFIVYLEYIMFVAYPITGQFVMMSVSALFVGWWSAPFFCILYGFLFIQVFLVPSKSSFAVNDIQLGKTSNGDIIGPMEKTLLIFNLLSIPGSLFIIIHFMDFLRLTTWVQLLICGFLPMFLCTCLNISDVINFLELRPTTIPNVRSLSGVACLMLISLWLWLSNLISSQGLPLLFVNMVISMAIIISAKTPQRKKFHNFCLLVLAIFYFGTIGSFLFDNIVTYEMQFAIFWVILLSILSVASIWICNHKQAFSNIMVLQSAGMVLCEFYLINHNLYSVQNAIFSAVVVIYLMFRLLIVNMVNWQTAWLCWSFQSSKIPLAINFLAPQHSLGHGYLWQESSLSQSPLICVVSSIIIIKILFFHDDTTSSTKTGIQLYFGLGLAILMAYDSLILPFWILLSNRIPSGADFVATFLLLWGLLCLRISQMYFSHNLIMKRMNGLILCAGVLIEMLQLDFNIIQVVYSLGYYMTSLVYPLSRSIDAENIALSWLLFGSCISCLLIIVKLVRLEVASDKLKCLFAILIGLPIGMNVASLTSDIKMFLPLSYGASTSFALYLLYASWNKFGENGDIHKGYSFMGLIASFFASLLLEFSLSEKDAYQRISGQNYLTVFLMLAIGLKTQRNPVKESLEESKGKLSNINIVFSSSSLANILVVLSYLIAILLCPSQYWNLWLPLCAFILLLWRHEGLQLNIPRPFFASILLIASLYIGTIMTALPLYFAVLPIIGFIMEMVVLHISLPSHLSLIYSIWANSISLKLQKLAVFSGPLNIFLLVYCSTTTGRILGFIGLLSTYWTFYHVECIK